MSKFVKVALVLVLVALVVSVTAIAEQTYKVDSVVISWNTISFNNFEIEVVDEDGNIMAYYANKIPHIGDVVTLTIFDFGDEELNEIIDVETVDRLSTLEIVEWLRR